MANELQLDRTFTGESLYAIITNSASQIWNGVEFVTPTPVNWSTYAVMMTEVDGTGYYKADFPAGIVTAGEYGISIRKQLGGAPFPTDTLVGEGSLYWTGTEEEVLNTNAIALKDLLLDWETIVAPVPDRCSLQAQRALRNKVDADSDPGVMHVKKENDEDDAWVADLETDESAQPITGITPRN